MALSTQRLIDEWQAPIYRLAYQGLGNEGCRILGPRSSSAEVDTRADRWERISKIF